MLIVNKSHLHLKKLPFREVTVQIICNIITKILQNTKITCIIILENL